MLPISDHICVCICTFKRPNLLKRLLECLCQQLTNNRFSFSTVVVDNDYERSAEQTVKDLRTAFWGTIDYHVEPIKNIALARNRALRSSTGDYIAFIDDDEAPPTDWLLNLYLTCTTYGSSAVLGPVEPQFDHLPPKWIVRGKLCERKRYPTGTLLHWTETRTGNVLIRRSVFDAIPEPFRREFRVGGEDIDFFRRLSAAGHQFVWCDEAPVYELIPPERCTKKYFLRRAYLQGHLSSRYFDDKDYLRKKRTLILKSFAGTIIYTFTLPVTAFFGAHIFMTYLTKDVHHFSRLLALLGIVNSVERNI